AQVRSRAQRVAGQNAQTPRISRDIWLQRNFHGKVCDPGSNRFPHLSFIFGLKRDEILKRVLEASGRKYNVKVPVSSRIELSSPARLRNAPDPLAFQPADRNSPPPCTH